MPFRTRLAILAAAFLSLTVFPSRAADTLPSQLSDEAYWRLISDFSEADAHSIFDAAFARFRQNLAGALFRCGSGKELVEMGFGLDVELALRHPCSIEIGSPRF
jgi:hypothetical protein